MNEVMAGMDLHRNNVVCGLVDQDGRRVVEKRLPCELETIVQWLEPYRTRLRRIAIESTYNWYWLVDGLQEADFDVVLANPARIEQYSGLKHADDSSDAFFLAELLRLNILPTGHIYERQLRPVRDLLRRRLLLVRQAAALKLSFKSLYARTTGQTLSLSRLQRLTPAEVPGLFAHGAEQLIAQEQLRLIGELGQSIAQIELAVVREVKDWASYRWVQTIPGVGKILGLTIALETGPITRFASAGDYASYCRCVRSQRVSNGKVKGANNGKNGNRYLAWAWVEAAQFARRYYGPCRRFFDRKAGEVNGALASKALACKLAKAGWHVMREGVLFDWSRAFPGGVPGGEPERQVRAAGAPRTPPPPHRPALEKDPTSLTPLGSVSSRVSPGRGDSRTAAPSAKTRSKTQAKGAKPPVSTESRTKIMKKRT